MDYLNIDQGILHAQLRLPTVEDIRDSNLDLWNSAVISKTMTLKTREENFVLPPASSFFSSAKWMLPPMEILKTDLTRVKSNLNGLRIDEWHSHTRSMNPYSSVIKEIRRSISHEFCTVAWCKLFELLSCHEAVPKVVEEAAHQLNEIQLSSMHLCEAPGAFVAALNHYLKTKYKRVDWNWLATTLNPYYEGNDRSETLIQDEVILSTLANWSFLEDNTGNIMNAKNILNLRLESKRLKHVHLVTGDGSIDCANSPEDQELMTSHLHYCEIIAAIMVLSKGGNLVLKMFTFFESSSISNLFLLACFFEEVQVIKPCMSKEGNSEVYIVCRGFAGQNFLESERLTLLSFCDQISKERTLFSLNTIPDIFVNRVIDCAAYFARLQAQVICRNIKLFPFGSSIYRSMSDNKSMLAKQWIYMTGLKPLHIKNYLLRLEKTKKSYYFVCDSVERFGGSYDERKSLSALKQGPDCLSFICESLQNLSNSLGRSSFKMELPKFNSVCVKEGKFFQDANSSRFCNDKILQLSKTVREYINENTKSPHRFFSEHSPLCSNCSAIVFDNAATTIFCYNRESSASALLSTEFALAMQFLQKFCQAMTKLEQGSSIFLCSYPLLTRFNFGFIVLLRCYFQKGFMCHQENRESCPAQGVLMENFLGLDLNPELWSSLVHSVSINSNHANDKTKQIVLELLPVTVLCRKPVCEDAITYNSNLLLRNLQWKIEVSKHMTDPSNDIEMTES